MAQSVIHQGWQAAEHHKKTSGVLAHPQPTPYPKDSSCEREYRIGYNRSVRNEDWREPKSQPNAAQNRARHFNHEDGVR